MNSEGFSKLRLDGTAVEWCRIEHAKRLKEVLRRAIEQKTLGKGVFCRPETDPALVMLMGVLHELEPNSGWLDAALLTYAWSLDDALRMAPQIWWGHGWRGPAGVYPLGYDMVKALLSRRAPTSTAAGEALRKWFDPINPVVPQLDVSPPVRDRRQRVYDEVSRRVFEMRRFLNRPDGSFPRVSRVELEPIPRELGMPLWRNDKVPPLPRAGTAYLRRFGSALMRTTESYLKSARVIYENAGPLLGREPLPSPGEKRGVKAARKFFSNSADLQDSDLIGIDLFDRLFGGGADALLQAILGATRLAYHDLRWGGNLTFHWDIVTGGLLVNDQQFLRLWAQIVPSRWNHHPRANRECCRLTKQWIESPVADPNLPMPKVKTGVEGAFVTAMVGLIRRDVGLVNAGVVELLAHFPKKDFCYWRGRKFLEHCMPAVAIQRAAIRAGLRPAIPRERPNDPELVLAPDPQRPNLPWFACPGIDLLLSDATLAWPTLYLNQPVHDIDEPCPGIAPSVF